jgi:hypothetical protein
MITNKILYLIFFTVLLSCENESTKNVRTIKKSTNSSKSNVEKRGNIKSQEELDLIKYYKSFLNPITDKIEGFEFKFGYNQYDEDKFGFDNPGYLEISKNGKIIFKDKFKGEGPVYIKSLGYHKLSGNKLLFSLNYGTEACDYVSHERYYVINSNDKISYINHYSAQSGGDGYASFFYDHIFPEDSLGEENTLLIIEGLKFHQHDQDDLFDTTRIYFTNNSFTLKKRTNNIGKAK